MSIFQLPPPRKRAPLASTWHMKIKQISTSQSRRITCNQTMPDKPNAELKSACHRRLACPQHSPTEATWLGSALSRTPQGPPAAGPVAGRRLEQDARAVMVDHHLHNIGVFRVQSGDCAHPPHTHVSRPVRVTGHWHGLQWIPFVSSVLSGFGSSHIWSTDSGRGSPALLLGLHAAKLRHVGPAGGRHAAKLPSIASQGGLC